MKKLKKILKYIAASVSALIVLLIIGALLIFSPIIAGNTEMKTSKERIEAFPKDNFPIANSANIYWNEHMVPFIETESDSDAAFLLGAVNAHLRLGQMELLKMVAMGRLAEMGGPLATKIDMGLRTLDIDKAVDGMIENQDDHTRIWVQSYVDGINWYMTQMEEEPIEYKQLRIPRTQWTPKDIYRLARLASADLSWGIYIQALLNQQKPGWEETWAFLLDKGQKSIPSYTFNSAENVSQLFNHISKSGSNSLVVSKEKSFNNHALMANDPHLGIFAPNMWFLVGIKSPSYHMVGMQIPGIPFIALGRNTDIAWGGTNMRSISSHLIELTEEQVQNAETYVDTIDVRFWFDKKIKIRVSEYGPIITDLPFLSHVKKTIAIQWLGHEPTNELISFLKANRAANFEAFRKAFSGYAVSGQNMLYADNKGNIGQIPAYSQPMLNDPSATLTLIKKPDNAIIGKKDSYDLPFSFNPELGFIASANNLPYPMEIPIAYEYSGYNRMQRMTTVCQNSDSITIEMLKDLQTDVLSYESLEVRAMLIEKLNNQTMALKKAYPTYWNTLESWDGRYNVESKGAVAFETMMYYFVSELLKDTYSEKYMQNYFMNDDRWKSLLPGLLKKETAESVEQRLLKAMRQGKKHFSKYETWGVMHRLVFGSPLARIPIIGKKYRLKNMGVGGTTHTLMKTAQTFTPKKHTISYGSNSRHISNMEDIDENYFVLLGGQDGWVKSPHNIDQLDLWQNQEYIKIPLRIESVKQKFNYFKTEIHK